MQRDLESLGLSNNEADSTPGSNTRQYVDATIGKLHVFFDGTGNNYFNTTATPPEQRAKRDDSYGNDLSNVARMWKALDGHDNVVAVYVEGIGTTKDKSDSLLGGAAFGMGETGIVDRVHGAFKQIQEIYKSKYSDETDFPAFFDVNVFGFSRGAAAARHFIYLLNTKSERLKYFTDPKWKVPTFRANFVGLFDCVAHYGAFQDNDVQDLHMEFNAKNCAQKVFHLVASDEYRDNFNLSTIDSALTLSVKVSEGERPMGRQLRIPGAHSDVGGGYLSKKTETHTLSQKTLEPWAIEQGWYTEKNCIGDGYRLPRERYMRPPDRIFQRVVAGESWKIALTLMVDQVNDQVPDLFRDSDGLSDPPSDALLQRLHTDLKAFAKNEKNTEWALDVKWSRDDAKALRHQFLHLSFGGDIGMSVRLNAQGFPERQVMRG